MAGKRKYCSGLFKRILGTFVCVTVYFIMSCIKLPFTDVSVRMSITELGVSPYISASILVSLFSAVVPSFARMRRDGRMGLKRVTAMTFGLSLIFSVISAGSMAAGLSAAYMLETESPYGMFLPWAVLCTVSVFITGMGLLIDRKFFGNGVSIMLCAGILKNLPEEVFRILSDFGTAAGYAEETAAAALLIIFGITACLFAGCETEVPLVCPRHESAGFGVLSVPLMPGGILPAVFASSFLSLFAVIAALTDVPWIRIFDSGMWFLPEAPVYSIGFFIWMALIFAFTGYSRRLTGGAYEISENLRRAGVLIRNVAPGKATEEYLAGLMSRMNRTGAFGLCVFAGLPVIVSRMFPVNVPSGIGTSFLILASVAGSCVSEYMAEAPAGKAGKRMYRNSYGLLEERT